MCIIIVLIILVIFWSFIEKTSVKQDPKPQVCSNKFSDFLFALKSDGPPSRGISGQLDIWSTFGSG